MQSAFLSAPAQAAIPQTIGYQGRLKNATGTVLTGTYTFIFRMYASSTGGAPVYTETQTGVTVDQGVFAVQLGSVTPFPASLDFTQPLFLTTEVNGDGEMSPRVAINTVPYAYTSGGVNALASAPASATGGRMYYDTTNGSLNYFDTLTSAWVQLGSSTASFQTVTNAGNVTTNAIQFAGGTSTGDLLPSVDATLALGSAGLRWNGVFGSVTTTDLVVTTGVALPNDSITDPMVVNGLTIDATGNISASAINSGTLGNGAVTLALGNFGAITGTLTDANVSNILTINGGSINNTAIGTSTPSTAVFTETTSTFLNATDLSATNATIANLTVTGAAPSGFANLVWTNATGTYTTTTYLFANAAVFGGVTTTDLRAEGSTHIENLDFVDATGTNLFTTGVVSSTFIHAQESTIGVATASILNVDTVLHVGVGNFPVVGNSVAQFGGTTDTFLQVNNQNHSSGGSASTDYVATNDIGDDTSYYIDMGINSSGYNDPSFSITGPNDGYLYTQSSDLVMGTGAATGTVKFHAGGTTAADEVMRITSDHFVGIGTTAPSSTLDVLGDGRFSGVLSSDIATTTSLFWTDATGVSLAVLARARLPSDTLINGTSVCLLDGTNCPSGTSPSFQTVTNSGNTTTKDIQFNGGTSTGSFKPSVDAVLSLGSSALRWNADLANVTSTNATSTYLFASNGTVTDLSFASGTSTVWFGFNVASGSALAAGIVDASSLIAGSATVTALVATDSTSTNAFAVNGTMTNGTMTNGTVTNLSFTNGTSTSWFGFATASGTAVTALTGTFNILNSSNVALTGGTIDGVRIGGTTPSTAVFTDSTTTNATTTNFFATNATIANLTVTGSSPSSFANVIWTDATGTNTTSTNLFATFATLSETVIASSTISIPSLGGTTFTQSDVNNDVAFPGWVSGGDVTVTGAGTYDVSAGVGYLRAIDSSTAKIYRVTWPAVSGFTIATGTVHYVYVSYNGGSPQIVASVTAPPNNEQYIMLANVVRGVLTTSYTYRRQAVDFGGHIYNWSNVLLGFRVGSGEVMSATTTRFIELSGGDVFDGYLREFTTSNFDSASGSTFIAIYRDGLGGLNSVPGQTQWDNTQIDAPAGTLTTMTDTFYANKWVFRAQTGLVYVVYGQAEYATQAEAAAEAAPPKPAVLDNIGYYVTQITFQKGGTAPAQVTSIKPVVGSTASVANGGGASDHNSLSGLQGGQPGQEYHLTQAQHAFLTNTSTPSAGAVLFSDAVGLTYDASHLHWDDANDALTIAGGFVATDATTTNATGTNLFVMNGTITNLSFTNGTSTAWFGFATASGTTINALNGDFTNLASPNAALTGGTIDGVAIGGTAPATGVFTQTTSTFVNATDLSATNATIANLTVTGSSPSSFANLIWTNATGTNTTSTNLFATNGTLTNGTVSNLSFTDGTGTNVTTTNLSVSGNVGTSLIPTVDAALALGSSGLRWNADLGSVTSTSVTSTSMFSSNASFTTLTATTETVANIIGASGTIAILNNTTLNGTNAVFSNTTSTNATSTNLSATNATITNLSVTGGAPSNFTNLIWTNATGTNTTSTNLFVTNGTVANGTITTLAFTNGTGASATTTNLAVTGSISVPNNSITDVMVVNGLTIDGTGNINASAINSGTLGNGGVTFAIGSFGSITGTLTDANVADILTVNGGTINNSPIGATTPSTGVFTNVTSTNATTTNLAFTSASGSSLLIGGKRVCLQDGTNCPSFSGSSGIGNVKYASTTVSTLLPATGFETSIVSVTITPSSTSNLIWINVAGYVVGSESAGTDSVYSVRRGNCTTTSPQVGTTSTVATKAALQTDDFAMSVVDVPATTTAVTYRLCGKLTNNLTRTVNVNAQLVAQTTGQGADLGEVYYTNDPTIAPGEVVSIDPSLDAGVMRSTTPDDPNVLGIISTRPGELLSNPPVDGGTPVILALSGRVPVKATTMNGDIAPGDLLTSSPIPGVAMRSTTGGAVIGKALTGLTGSENGVVVAFVQRGAPAVRVDAASASGDVTVATTTFRGDVVIARHLDVGQDIAGEAKILSGATEVRVSFAETYDLQPIVTVTPMDFIDTMYRVTDVDDAGFTIQLNNPMSNDKLFSWHAVGSEGGKIFVSDGTTQDIQLVTHDAPTVFPPTETETASSTADTVTPTTGTSSTDVSSSSTEPDPTSPSDTATSTDTTGSASTDTGTDTSLTTGTTDQTTQTTDTGGSTSDTTSPSTDAPAPTTDTGGVTTDTSTP